jgi:superfamily II DNA/RNA helicase
MENFIDLGINPSLAETLAARRISSPTAIQRLVIPPLLEGKKLLFRSATGTGKTLAYLLPALELILQTRQRLSAENEKAGDEGRYGASRYLGPLVLICAPTFELCSQIKAEADTFSLPDLRRKPENTALLIGSVSLNRQIETLKKSKPLIAVGNPGRLLVLAKMGKLKTGALRFLVLDEADRLCAEESIAETAELLRLIAHNGRKGADVSLDTITLAACSATVSVKTK